jgi:hypothetical protein
LPNNEALPLCCVVDALSSSTTTWCVRDPSQAPPVSCGRLTRDTSSSTASTRSSSTIHCSMRRRFLLRFSAASKNSIAAHGTRRNRRRLSRWMTMGTAHSGSAHSSAG